MVGARCYAGRSCLLVSGRNASTTVRPTRGAQDIRHQANGGCAPARQDMFKQEAMKPGKVLIMALWLLNYFCIFRVSRFPAQNLISVVKLHPIKSAGPAARA